MMTPLEPEPLCREVERSLASMPDLATYIIHAANPIACRPTTIIYSHSNRPNLASPALRLVPHRLQMLDNRQVSIQKPIHTVLRASLLSPLQLPAANRPRNAFLPADIRQIVNGLLDSCFLGLIVNEHLQLLLVTVR